MRPPERMLGTAAHDVEVIRQLDAHRHERKVVRVDAKWRLELGPDLIEDEDEEANEISVTLWANRWRADPISGNHLVESKEADGDECHAGREHPAHVMSEDEGK